MSDIAAPLLALCAQKAPSSPPALSPGALQPEVDAWTLLRHVLARFGGLFEEGGRNTVDRYIGESGQVTLLAAKMSPTLHAVLNAADEGQYLFLYRLLLVLFKRNVDSYAAVHTFWIWLFATRPAEMLVWSLLAVVNSHCLDAVAAALAAVIPQRSAPVPDHPADADAAQAPIMVVPGSLSLPIEGGLMTFVNNITIDVDLLIANAEALRAALGTHLAADFDPPVDASDESSASDDMC
jgi:hypothetical protein